MPLLRPGPDRGVAPALHRQRARAGRVHPADGAEGQGHHAGHRRVLVLHPAPSSRRRWRCCRRWRWPSRWRCSSRSARRAVQAGGGVSVRQASIEVRDLVVRYGAVVAVRGVTLRRRRGRAPDPARPLGLRQDDDAAGDRRARAAGVGRDPDRRQPGLLVRRAGERPRRAPRAVDGLPVVRHLAAHERVRQRGLRPAGAEAAGRRGDGAGARGARPGPARRPRRAAAPPSSPAASSSAWPSPAPSSSRPRCSSSTSRCRTSTPSCARRCGSS